IDPHRHDWPVLAIYRLGAYREEIDGVCKAFDGPSVVFHPAGAEHADEVTDAGLETVSMSFDPAWLEPEARALLPDRSWSRAAGLAALAAGKLASLWLRSHETDTSIRTATSRFVKDSIFAPQPQRPPWVNGANLDTAAQNLHPAWVARAYRA